MYVQLKDAHLGIIMLLNLKVLFFVSLYDVNLGRCGLRNEVYKK